MEAGDDCVVIIIQIIGIDLDRLPVGVNRGAVPAAPAAVVIVAGTRSGKIFIEIAVHRAVRHPHAVLKMMGDAVSAQVQQLHGIAEALPYRFDIIARIAIEILIRSDAGSRLAAFTHNRFVIQLAAKARIKTAAEKPIANQSYIYFRFESCIDGCLRGDGHALFIEAHRRTDIAFGVADANG